MMKRQDWPLCRAPQFAAGLLWLVESLTLGQGKGVTGRATLERFSSLRSLSLAKEHGAGEQKGS